MSTSDKFDDLRDSKAVDDVRCVRTRVALARVVEYTAHHHVITQQDATTVRTGRDERKGLDGDISSSKSEIESSSDDEHIDTVG